MRIKKRFTDTMNQPLGDPFPLQQGDGALQDPRPLLPRWISFALVAFGVGCTPKIGDECVTALDCSPLGDRLCDSTQPAGYCTIFNCEPDTCPDEAVCVAFKEVLDPACGSLDDSRFGRFGRTFCMRICEESDDCRAGYECARPIDRTARVVDLETEEDDPQNTQVCLAEAKLPPAQQGPTPGTCIPNEGGGMLTPYQPPSGGGGMGGTGGIGGSGGFGGMGGGVGGVGGAAGSGGN